MDKSARGSMFDGLQIFGKTDAKFSMTTSLQNLATSSSHPVRNSNYQFDNTSVLLPPGPPERDNIQPSTSISEDGEELPPDSYPLEPTSLDPRQLGPRGEHIPKPRTYSGGHGDRPIVHNQQKKMAGSVGLPKTWTKSSKTTLPEESISPVSTSISHPVQDDLPPLQKVSFRGPSPSRKMVSNDPPAIPSSSPEPDPVTSEASRTAHFFEKASSEIQKFEDEVNRAKDDHQVASASILDEMKHCEDTIRANSLLSIQRLLMLEKSVSLVADLQTQIKTAIETNSFDEAETLQSSFENVQKDVHQSQLLQFKPPRQLDLTEENLKVMNVKRKTHVESLKNFCVSLDELSGRFETLTKKIEVQCSSKVDKQKQELQSAQSALEFQQKHISIDRDYLDQRETDLMNELRATTDDNNLQMKYQDELLGGIQSEIRTLEERLKKLRDQESNILDEKRKLITEKVETEKVHQKKMNDLNKEKDRCHVKSVSLESDRSRLATQNGEFQTYVSKLSNISTIQHRVNDHLSKLKSKTCDSISSNEDLIVNEVHVSVTSDVSSKLQIPSSLSDIMNDICTQEKLIDLKSSDVFEKQRQISQMKSDELMAQSNLKNCKSLKNEAISKKRFQDAAKISKEEFQIESELNTLSREIATLQKAKADEESEMNDYFKTLEKLRLKAADQQSLFDKECYKTLLSNLVSTLESLAQLPADLDSISRSLLEYDVCYIYSFLKMIKRRNKGLGVAEENELLNEENTRHIEELLNKIEKETGDFQSEAQRLKEEVDTAIRCNDFDKAEKLSPKYELFACLQDGKTS